MVLTVALYKCPFCKIEIEDGIDNLLAHREPDGECDRAQLEKYPDRERA